MRTPPLLDPRPEAAPPHRPDPVAFVLVTLLVLVLAGLFWAGCLAVFTYQTPSLELPVVLVTAVLFGVALLLAIVSPAWRRLREYGSL